MAFRLLNVFAFLLHSSLGVPEPTGFVDLGQYSQWTLTGLDPSHSVTVPASLPGQVHLDLLRGGYIGEPYAQDHASRTSYFPPASSWVGNISIGWLYQTAFSTPPVFSSFKYTRTEIVAYGLDAVASVTLNGKSLGATSNAFRRWVFPVNLSDSTNSLAVLLAAPIPFAEASEASCMDSCPAAGRSGIANSSYESYNYIRKPAVHFGWDFAPPLPTTGIWKPLVWISTDFSMSVVLLWNRSGLSCPSAACVGSAWLLWCSH
jgi:beta-mannosidase